MNKAPCKDCPDRHYLCHDTCEKYSEYRKERQSIIEKRKRYNETWPIWQSQLKKSPLRRKFNYHFREKD